MYITVTDPIQTGTDNYYANWYIIDNIGTQYACSQNTTNWQSNTTMPGITFTANIPDTQQRIYRLVVIVTRPNSTPAEQGYAISNYFNSSEFLNTIFYMTVRVQ